MELLFPYSLLSWLLATCVHLRVLTPLPYFSFTPLPPLLFMLLPSLLHTNSPALISFLRHLSHYFSIHTFSLPWRCSSAHLNSLSYARSNAVSHLHLWTLHLLRLRPCLSRMSLPCFSSCSFPGSHSRPYSAFSHTSTHYFTPASTPLLAYIATTAFAHNFTFALASTATPALFSHVCFCVPLFFLPSLSLWFFDRSR